MHKEHQRGNNSKSIKARALIFVHDSSLRPILYNGGGGGGGGAGCLCRI